MVTAAHVLNDIGGDVATIYVRYKSTVGEFSTDQRPLSIRLNGANLYQTHPSADVAAMLFPLGVKLTTPTIPTTWLVGDDQLQKLEIHPGDTLFSLGFPETASSGAMFPMLREGVIAPYPLLPTQKVKTWEYYMRIFHGNSGGPVYYAFQNRPYGGYFHGGETTAGIVGLISGRFERLSDRESIMLAVIVPATFIREKIDKLNTIK